MLRRFMRWRKAGIWASLAMVACWAAIGVEAAEPEGAPPAALPDDVFDLVSGGEGGPIGSVDLSCECEDSQHPPWLAEPLRRAPDMFGDLHTVDRIALFTRTNPPADFVTADLPLSGATRRVKISDHNRALPTDRAYLLYQHFHGALRLERTGAPGQGFPIDKLTLGAEKTFWRGRWSLEARLPFTEGHRVADPAVLTDFTIAGGQVGNASLVLKHLLYAGSRLGLAAGLGVSTPTGSDVAGSLPLHDFPLSFQVRNKAYQVLPFVGAVATEGDQVFGHLFLQLDVGTNGNLVSFSDTNGNSFATRFNEQTLLYLDASYGRWLFHPPRPTGLVTGIAAMIELHYATSLAAPDLVPVFQFGQFQGSLFDEIVNVAAGVNVELSGQTHLRVAGVFPFDGRPDRGFDAAWIASLIRRL